MTKRKPGPRPAVIGTCTLAIRGIEDADELLATPPVIERWDVLAVK